MQDDDVSLIEAASRAAWTRKDFQAAATSVLEGYGPELYSFLAVRLHGKSGDVDDAFSDFSEDLWRGLPKFEWRCSIRAWCYKLARSAAARLQRLPVNQRARHLPLSGVPWLESLVHRTRTITHPHLRTDVKDRFQELRDHLRPEDQDLLILRVDRGLPWREVAQAMLDTDADPDEVDLRRAEAALRQRFAEVKARLKQLAEEAGLLDDLG